MGVDWFGQNIETTVEPGWPPAPLSIRNALLLFSGRHSRILATSSMPTLKRTIRPPRSMPCRTSRKVSSAVAYASVTSIWSSGYAALYAISAAFHCAAAVIGIGHPAGTCTSAPFACWSPLIIAIVFAFISFAASAVRSMVTSCQPWTFPASMTLPCSFIWW